MNPSLGRVAVVMQLVTAFLLAGIVVNAGAREAGTPDFLPRPLVLLLVYALPGVVGWLGVRRRRPALLIAASITSFVGSFLAFSGVTLIFLVPSILFAFGAAALAASPAPGDREGLLGGIGRLLASVVIAGLLIGAGGAAVLITDSACWNVYSGVTGPRFQMIPFSNELSPPIEASGSGCSTGLISPRGIGLAAALWGGALGLADLSSRRRDRRRDDAAAPATAGAA